MTDQAMRAAMERMAMVTDQRDRLRDRLERAEAALRGLANAYGCFAGCTGSLPGSPADGSGHTPACRAARAYFEEAGN